MAHTPGPWKVKSRDATRHKIVGGGGTIATIISTSKHPPKVKEANARLIAAAPALLEACQFALDKLNRMTTDEFSKGGDKATREKLEQVLAQVEC